MARLSETHAQDIDTVKTAMELSSNFTDTITSKIYDETLQHDACNKLVGPFGEYMESVKDQGKLSQF